jgi:plasmid stability protein
MYPMQGLHMRSTCSDVQDMSVMIQIRNVPDDLHRRLKARAAMAGMSLSFYLLKEISAVAERPTMEEMRERLARRSRVETSESAADIIREVRGPLP